MKQEVRQEVKQEVQSSEAGSETGCWSSQARGLTGHTGPPDTAINTLTTSHQMLMISAPLISTIDL